VNDKSIAWAVTYFQVFGMMKVVVILHGNMTPKQQRRAREKSNIWTDYVIAAMLGFLWIMRNGRIGTLI
jgi:hypothetical protein